MKKLFVLLKYEAKLFSKALLPALLGGALLFLSCLAAAYSYSEGGKAKITKLTVAVSDEENTIFNRLAIGLIKRQDFISNLLVVKETDKESARLGVQSGEFAAAVILPEGFMDGIFYGENIPGEVLISQDIAFSEPVIKSLAQLGSVYLSSAQFGVFAGQSVLERLEGGRTLENSFTTGLNMSYISEVTSAGEKYSLLNTTDYFGNGTDIASHYALSYMLLFVFLCPLFFIRFARQGSDRGVLSRLSGLGVKPLSVILSKIFYPSLFSAFAALAASFILNSAMGFCTSAASYAYIVFAALYASVFGMCILLAIPGKNAAPLILVALACVGLFLKGAVIPPFMLGKGVLALGSRTPFGFAYAIAVPAAGGAADIRLYIAGAALLAIMPLLACLRLKSVITKGEDGT